MSRLILGTAGHIDHGKTALVHALTGTDTDRLPEEKERGITIDLGFAQLQLGEHTFGIVDVPGHESFIRNMLAGATGMDAVMLVIAADEGVMPQTREHLAILDLLDVRSGVVAITKSDLVSDEWIQLVIDDVRETIAETSLSGAPIIPVSARTGAGLDQLRAAIVEQAVRPTARNPADVFRMPIDRVFTVRGTGTVVTGTIWSGSIRLEESLDARPSALRARVRGIQVHGAAVDEARAGERTAIALAGVDRTAVARGDVLVRSDWVETRMLTIRARVIANTDWTLEMRQRLRVHLGTSEVLARAVLLDAEVLGPGAEGWVQLRLEEPMLARAGDRVVLRSYSPVTTIGGGVVAELAESKRRVFAEGLEEIVSGEARAAVRALLSLRGVVGASIAELAVHTPHAPDEVDRALADLSGDVVRIKDRVYSRAAVDEVRTAILGAIDRMHARNTLRPALERAEVKGSAKGIGGEVIDFVIDRLIGDGALVATGSGIARAGFKPALSAKQASLRSTIVATLRTAGLAAPGMAELAGTEHPDVVRDILRLLEAEGLVRAVALDLYVDAGALKEAEDRTRRELGGSSGLSASEFRSTLPVSRKHLIPLLEYFDRTGITRRDGDLRDVAAASDGG